MRSIARVLGVICVLALMLCPVLFSGGDAYADDPCWKVITGSGGLINPPTLTYNESYGVYFVSDSPFKYNGSSYNFGYYLYAGAWEYIAMDEFEGALIPIMMGEPMGWVDGEINVDVGLYSALTPPPEIIVHMTIYYANGNKSDLEDKMDEMMGSGNWSCDVYHEGVFVNESGEYVYHAPSPICETAPTPTLPPGDNVSEFIIPEYNESSAWVWSATVMNQTSGEGDSCEVWESIWSDGIIMAGVHPWNMVASVNMMETAAIARNILVYDTSSIPDDAIITASYLRVVPYQAMIIGDGEDIVVGGTHNISIFPIAYVEGEAVPLGYYSESDFYGDFGRLDIDEMPITMMEPNYNESLYMDAWFNSSGLSYINPEGLTALTLRTVGDAYYECPETSMSGEQLAIWAGNLSGEEPSPSTKLVVAWHMAEEDEEPIIPTGPVSAMMVVLGLVFTFGSILGIMVVLFKGESLALSFRVGVLLGLSIFAIIGIMIIETIIVATTR